MLTPCVNVTDWLNWVAWLSQVALLRKSSPDFPKKKSSLGQNSALVAKMHHWCKNWHLFFCGAEPDRPGVKAAALEVLPAGQGRSLHHAVSHRVCHVHRAQQAGRASASPQCHCWPPESGVPTHPAHPSPGNTLAQLTCIWWGRSYVDAFWGQSVRFHSALCLQELVVELSFKAFQKGFFRHWMACWLLFSSK